MDQSRPLAPAVRETIRASRRHVGPRQIRRPEVPAPNVMRFVSLRRRKAKFEGKAPEFRFGCHR
jgi:hypothetical protein